MKGRIEHQGVIDTIDGNHIRVRIEQRAACHDCKVKSMCTSSETKEKIIDVYDRFADRWAVGETVVVCGADTAGKVAVWLAFGGPLVIIIAWMLPALQWLQMSELVASGILLVLLAVYLFIINKVEKRFGRILTFWIEKGDV